MAIKPILFNKEIEKAMEERKLKQPKKPTRAQKELMAEHGLRPENWMVLTDNRAEMQIVSRRSGQRRSIGK